MPHRKFTHKKEVNTAMRKINKTDILRILRQQGLSLALAFIALFACVLYTFAWFQSQEKLQTITKVEAPSTLAIKGGNASDITAIDLSGIDLSSTEKIKYFIFCVEGSVKNPYLIELAHTTNIPFIYSINKASQNENGTFIYVDHSTGIKTNYQADEDLGCSYINKGTNGLANNSKHNATYGTYSTVQQNAEPLYFLSPSITPTLIGESNKFCDYYILKVSWEGVTPPITNEKETDLVYLLARNATT